jgi:hypothetical protein
MLLYFNVYMYVCDGNVTKVTVKTTVIIVISL